MFVTSDQVVLHHNSPLPMWFKIQGVFFFNPHANRFIASSNKNNQQQSQNSNNIQQGRCHLFKNKQIFLLLFFFEKLPLIKVPLAPAQEVRLHIRCDSHSWPAGGSGVSISTLSRGELTEGLCRDSFPFFVAPCLCWGWSWKSKLCLWSLQVPVKNRTWRPRPPSLWPLQTRWTTAMKLWLVLCLALVFLELQDGELNVCHRRLGFKTSPELCSGNSWRSMGITDGDWMISCCINTSRELESTSGCWRMRWRLTEK